MHKQLQNLDSNESFLPHLYFIMIVFLPSKASSDWVCVLLGLCRGANSSTLYGRCAFAEFNAIITPARASRAVSFELVILIFYNRL